MILYASNSDLKSISPSHVATVLGWVDELANISKFAQYTKYTGPEGSGIQTSLKTGAGKLRIDLQRVFNTGKVTTKEVVKRYEKGKLIDDKRFDEIQQMNKKQAPKVTETKETVSTYEAIWSLFAVQQDSSYNQVFVLNNPSFNITKAEWHEIFEKSLGGPYAAIITTAKTLLPSGFSEFDVFSL